jgi:hypothetical protein
MEPEPELTLKAKQAIRAYLLQLVTLPAVVVAILPVLLTYFIKDVALSKAQFDLGHEANKQLITVTEKLYADINNFTQKSTASRVTAEQELDKTTKLYADAQQRLTQTNELQRATAEAVGYIENLHNRARQMEASLALPRNYAESQDLVRDVTTALANSQSFVDLVESNLAPNIDLPIGTLLPSLVPPEAFLSGDRVYSWAPADGRQISPDSGYAKLTGKPQTPDLRGMFIRGLNEFERGVVRSDGRQDPDGNERTAGQLQLFTTAIPRNKFTGITSTAGRHTHSYDAARPFDAGAGSHDRAKPSGETKTTAEAGDHSHTIEISGGGDKETRPSNIAVYYYIRIN